MDVAFASVGLCLSLPVLLVLGLAIRATSLGPAIFVQPRVGRRERVFNCYKLRTMRAGTLSAATHLVSASSVTKLGHVLRRLKIDELPQLWNVLKGDMSLVGPRPGLPSQTELLLARRMRGVPAVRPGITGPGQVEGVDMSEPARLADLDASYAAAPTVSAYLRLIILTLLGHGQGDRVKGNGASPIS